VEIVRLRPVNPPPVPGQPATQFTHAVTQVTGFQVKDGRVQPIAPQPSSVQPVATPPPASYNPVRGMSIEEAKRLKLIKPTRLVPEDYGAIESTGAPKSGQDIPEIQYATDTVRGPRPVPLPKELAQPATPQQAAVIQSLNHAAAQNPEDPNVLKVASVPVASTTPPPAPVPVLPTHGPIPGLPKPQLTESSQPAPRPARVVAPPIPKNPEPTPMVVLSEGPEPAQDDNGLVVEEDLPPTEVQAAAANLVPAPPAEEVTTAEAAPADEGLTCPLCPKKSFTSLRYFKQHVSRMHPNDATRLLAPFVGAPA